MLSIRDPRAAELAKLLAAQRRSTMTEAIIVALENELKRERAKLPLPERLAGLAEKARRLAARIVATCPRTRSTNSGDNDVRRYISHCRDPVRRARRRRSRTKARRRVATIHLAGGSARDQHGARFAATNFAGAGERSIRRTARGGRSVGRVDRQIGELAVACFEAFGKGRHAARLNLGDCLSYACAKSHRSPLLFKGDDFSQTDIETV